MIKQAVLLVGCAALGLAGCTGSSPEGRLEAFLHAVAGAEADRGWSYLDELVRERGYDNDQSRYVRDATAADWAKFDWTNARVAWTDDEGALVEVDLLSSPSSVPAFLLEKRILNGRCHGHEPYGLGAFTGAPPSTFAQLGGGGLSGTQMRCDAQFIGDAAYERDYN